MTDLLLAIRARSMAKFLYSVSGLGTSPSLETAAKKMGVKVSSLDAEYGVLLIDPANETYCVMVEESAMGYKTSDDEVSGPFSNPAIAPFN